MSCVELTIYCDKATNLSKSRKINPFVMAWIKDKPETQVRTNVLTNTANPVWHESLKLVSRNPETDVVSFRICHKSGDQEAHLSTTYGVVVSSIAIGNEEARDISIGKGKRSGGVLSLRFRASSAVEKAKKTSPVKRMSSVKASRKQKIQLSTEGLSRAAMSSIDRFTFVIGEKEYECKGFQAAFISQKVAHMSLSDPTVDRFVIRGIDDDNQMFKLFIRMMNGNAVDLDDNNVEFIRSVSNVLVNDELDEIIINYILGREPLSHTNAVERMRLKVEHGMDSHAEVSYISTNFHDMPANDLESLTYDELEVVLSDGSLQLKSEDSLLDFIVRKGRHFEELIRYVECQFLTCHGIEQFIEAVSPEQIDAVLWLSICRRLQRDLQPSKSIQNTRSIAAPVEDEISESEFESSSASSSG